MTATQTDRFALYQWSSSNDEFTRAQMNDSNASLEFSAAKFNTGAGAPASSATTDTKAFYWDTTSSVLYFRGTVVGAVAPTWTQLSQTFATATQIQNTAATAGSGVNIARANHVHSVETATAVDINASTGAGSGTSLALANHTHAIPVLFITNAMIAANAQISPSKISGNYGDITAGTITAALAGNAATATKWATARTITLSTDASGSVTFDGSANATLAITVTNSAQATKLTTARTISLGGDATGSVSFDGSSATNTISATVATATALRTARTFTFTGDVATTNAGGTDVTASFDGTAAPTFGLKVKNDSHTHNGTYYTETELHSAKLYQYGNETSGQGVGLPSDAARTTPRVYVQATAPTYSGQIAVTGDIWFQIP